ncbi:helix-turn-helix transcriptional regulator [Saccharothrix australiensis]|uniref:Helix-turn-helix protein n=1 Tax=Saccharothrix australiensis TaxID=2072 RepID=A0A495VT72_9PSEU|nr:helix-turn-helix transcriptional regulator [Saccharothrix australiensis]RKT52424.1 helix-turn-helix protein [Saccharothrix australiensis]
MSPKNQAARDFLTTRRAKITPRMAGLPDYGTTTRRVPGLRREEVALLAGVSADYYTRMEKGNLAGVSEEVLDAVARALQLDEDERRYLLDLARAARRPTRAPGRTRRARGVSHRVQLLIDSMGATPVIAHDGCLDILGANPLGRALFSAAYDSPTRRSSTAHPNLAAFVFLDPAAQDFYADIDEAAAVCVHMLRAHAGAAPYDKHLTGLIGELSTRSPEFRTRWAAHDVSTHRAGAKALHHHDVGELILGFEQLTIASTPTITLSTYIAEPNSPTAERLQLLASWARTTTAANTPQP